jgi:hypothetical protein
MQRFDADADTYADSDGDPDPIQHSDAHSRTGIADSARYGSDGGRRRPAKTEE